MSTGGADPEGHPGCVEARDRNGNGVRRYPSGMTKRDTPQLKRDETALEMGHPVGARE